MVDSKESYKFDLGVKGLNSLYVAEGLFSNRSSMMSKCGKHWKVAHEVQLSVSLMFLHQAYFCMNVMLCFFVYTSDTIFFLCCRLFLLYPSFIAEVYFIGMWR